MANSIDWGKIYCFTEFGNEDFTIAEIIPAESSPECFLGALEGNQIETLALTIDDITLVIRFDNISDFQNIILFNL